jgi:hypothetical protein
VRDGKHTLAHLSPHCRETRGKRASGSTGNTGKGDELASWCRTYGAEDKHPWLSSVGVSKQLGTHYDGMFWCGFNGSPLPWSDNRVFHGFWLCDELVKEVVRACYYGQGRMQMLATAGGVSLGLGGAGCLGRASESLKNNCTCQIQW